MGVNGNGGIHLLDLAAVQQADAVGHDHGFVLVVGDKDGGNVQLLLDAADLHLQTLAQLGINGAQRLIQQQNFWPGDDGAGQCHTLLLAAGKLGRVGVGLVLQAHHGQSFGDTVVDLGLA